MLGDLVLPTLIAFALGLAVAGPVAEVMRRVDWVDPPGGHKAHSKPVPFGGVLFVVPLWWLLSISGHRALFEIGGGFLVLGVIEDVLKSRGREIPWLLRMTLFVALLLILPFFARAGVFTAGFEEQGWAGLLLLLGAVIAFNWLDHADGLAAAAGLGAAAALAVGRDWPASWGVALGILGAFLVVNAFMKGGARLYLGDAGAQLLGFTVVALALAHPGKRSAPPPNVTLALLAGLLPLLDTLRVIVMRLVQRVPPWRPDSRNHLAHQAWARFLEPPGLATAIFLVAFFLTLWGKPAFWSD